MAAREWGLLRLIQSQKLATHTITSNTEALSPPHLIVLRMRGYGFMGRAYRGAWSGSGAAVPHSGHTAADTRPMREYAH